MEQSNNQLIVTRKVEISASHRLHNPQLSDEENKNTFGKCNNQNGHGHNYKIYVSFRGPIDQKTGMVVNFKDMENYIQKAIVEPFDHKNLDLDVPELKNVVTTTENLVVAIWNKMTKVMQDPELLAMIKIKETGKNSVVYYG